MTDKIIVKIDNETYEIQDPHSSLKSDIKINGDGDRLTLSETVSATLETDTTRYIY